MDVLRFSLWSGPRNVSTAIMYAFAQRADTRVVDEPFYAHYLEVTGLPHPGREVVLANQESDVEKVIRDVVLGPCDRPVLFIKQMAHHLVDVDRSFLGKTLNGLLIRDPSDVLRTLPNQILEPTLADTALPQQVELYGQLVALGQDPPVLDARELLGRPSGVLEQLCERLGISFDAAMLSWERGPRPEDGPWAPYWYDGVHRSTGFEPYRPKTDPFPAELEALLEECQPYYEYLYSKALRAARG
jgi:hypothetical protein